MALTKAKLISDGVISTEQLADSSVTAAKLNNITTDDISEGTNKFATQSDLDKLSGIEALADVTDANNVAAAGALMSGTAVLSDLVDVSSATPVDGQVLTYDTANGWQPEDSQGGAEYTISEISTNTTAQKDYLYILTASLTLTLPASPSVGDKLAVVNTSGTTTPVVARNGSLIMGAAEDFTIDVDNVSIELIYSGASKGWVLVADSVYGTEAVPAGGAIYDDGTNVGIGTTSPNYRLTVAGNTSANTIAAINNTSNVSRFSFAENATPSNTYTNIEGDARSSGYLAFRTDDSERMRIISNGNIGVGTSVPAYKFEVHGTNPVIRLKGGAGFGFLIDQNSTTGLVSQILYEAADLRFGTNSTERVRITSAGNIGVNTTSPQEVSGYKFLTFDDTLGSGMVSKVNGTQALFFYSNVNGSLFSEQRALPLIFETSGSERMRMGSDGRLLIGCTSTPSSSVSGVRISDPIQAACTFSAGSVTTSVTQLGFINGNGVVGTIRTDGSSTAYNTSSDYRLKENVIPMSGALDRLSALKPSKFNFIADPNKTVDGFLAHEVAEVVPEAITGEKDAVDENGDPIYQGIDQSKLVPLLTAAIQELKAEIETLKTQINS